METETNPANQAGFHNHSLDEKAIRMSQVESLAEEMADQGFPADVSLTETGIEVCRLGEEDPLVSYQQRIKQLDNMLKLLGSDGSWLQTARTVAISEYGLFGCAMMRSATLQQAVEIAVKCSWLDVSPSQDRRRLAM